MPQFRKSWPASDRGQQTLFNYALRLNGFSLVVGPQGGATYRLVNTTNWKVTKR